MSRLTLRAVAACALAAASFAASAQGAQPSAAKRELLARFVQLQQPGIEALARGMVEQSAANLLEQAGTALARVPSDRRDSARKAIDASARRFVDETAGLVRDRAVQIAPTALGAALDQRFSDEEMRQLVAWFESPLSRKYQQSLPELHNSFTQALVADGRPIVEPRLRALEDSIRSALGSEEGRSGKRSKRKGE